MSVGVVSFVCLLSTICLLVYMKPGNNWKFSIDTFDVPRKDDKPTDVDFQEDYGFNERQYGNDFDGHRQVKIMSNDNLQQIVNDIFNVKLTSRTYTSDTALSMIEQTKAILSPNDDNTMLSLAARNGKTKYIETDTLKIMLANADAAPIIQDIKILKSPVVHSLIEKQLAENLEIRSSFEKDSMQTTDKDYFTTDVQHVTNNPNNDQSSAFQNYIKEIKMSNNQRVRRSHFTKTNEKENKSSRIEAHVWNKPLSIPSCLDKCFYQLPKENCSCDVLCFKRASCCLDIDTHCYNVRQNAEQFYHIELLEKHAVCDVMTSVFVITSCPVDVEITTTSVSEQNRFQTFVTDVETRLVYQNIATMQCHNPDSYGRARYWKLVVVVQGNTKMNNVDEILSAANQEGPMFIPPRPSLGGIKCGQQYKGQKSPFSITLNLDPKLGVEVTRKRSSSWLRMVCSMTDNKTCRMTECDENLAPASLYNGKCKYRMYIKLTITLPWQIESEEKSEFQEDETNLTVCEKEFVSSTSCKISVRDIARSIACLLQKNYQGVDVSQTNIHYDHATKPLSNLYGDILSAKRNFSMYTLDWHFDSVGELDVRDSINRYLSALFKLYEVAYVDVDDNMIYQSHKSRNNTALDINKKQCPPLEKTSFWHISSMEFTNCILTCIEINRIGHKGTHLHRYCYESFSYLKTYENNTITAPETCESPDHVINACVNTPPMSKRDLINLLVTVSFFYV